MYRLAYRNFGDHESLVVTHSVTAGSSVGMRWYELRSPSGDADASSSRARTRPTRRYRWMGSVAHGPVGDIALGYSVSSSTPFTRASATPAASSATRSGTMTPGRGHDHRPAPARRPAASSRWGDYTSMSVDPADDCTFWYTNEYIPVNGAFNWQTRIGSFKFRGCAARPPATTSRSPRARATLSVAQGGSGHVDDQHRDDDGSAQSVSLSASGQPAGTTGQLQPDLGDRGRQLDDDRGCRHVDGRGHLRDHRHRAPARARRTVRPSRSR